MNHLQVVRTTVVCGKDFSVYGTAEEPLFLAKEIAEVLDYSKGNASKLVDLVDEDEKVRNIITTLGGEQEMWLVTESGLYEILMQSRKPIAKQFKKGVKQILHEIRTTGGYIATRQGESDDEILERALMIAQKKIKQREEQLKIAEQKIESDAPKVLFADAVATSKRSCLISELSKILQQNGVKDMGQNKLFQWMRDKGYLCQKGQMYNQPTKRRWI